MNAQTDIESYSVVQRARVNGCTAKTPAGIVRWLRTHPNKSLPHYGWVAMEQLVPHWPLLRLKSPRTDRWSETPIADESLAVEAVEWCNRKHPRRKNYRSPEPKPTWAMRMSPFECGEENMGRYSSRCTFTRWEYYPLYQSSLRVWKSNRTVELWQRNAMVRRIIAPAGLRFGVDDLGVRVISPDGTDYHPTVEEWRSSRFASLIRAALTAKRQSVRQAALASRESSRVAKIRERQMASCRVNLDDSRKAGNCVEGSLRFAESRMGLSRSEILSGGHLVHVSGASLLRTGDERAKRAVEIAWQRETVVSI